MGPPPTAPGGLRSNALPQMYQPVRSAARSTSSVSSGHSCQAAGGIFAHLLELAGRPPLTSTIEKERFGLFAQLPTGKLEEGWINLHLLLWKHLIALIVAIELEGEKYAEHKVWAPAWRRFQRKVAALQERLDKELRRQRSRGEPIKVYPRRAEPMRPIADISEAGDVVWNDDLVTKIRRLTTGQGNAVGRCSTR